MNKNFKKIFREVLEKVELSEKDYERINYELKLFLEKIKKAISKNSITAEAFVGGSFAKKTMIKKDKYDIDLFIRFDKKYSEEEMENLAEKILKNLDRVIRVHGSRDYFQIKIDSSLFIELIPVKKISNSSQAENITDLSYSHVHYINKKITDDKILQEIKIAKAFCYANKCYGAESYINGFSGYSLELLIYHYKTFLKFLNAVSNLDDKLIIDIEKDYKNKQEVLMNLNSSKLNSPIILIDPTFKKRNALAALSKETFEKFQKIGTSFLKNPSIKFFEQEKTDLQKIKQESAKKNYEFVLIEIKTEKQEGDIAGSKLLKFYNHLIKETEIYFEIKNKGFNYNGKKSARFFVVGKNKKERLFEGPFAKDKLSLKKFEKAHKNYFIKNARVYAKEKINFNLKEFIQKWVRQNKKKIKQMYIENIELLD